MKVRINKNEPTPAQKEVLKAECRREFNKLLDMYNHDTAVQVIHITDGGIDIESVLT